MLLRSLLVVCCCALAARAEDPKPVKPTLPEWHGTWEGALQVRTPGGKTLEVPVELKIEPIKGSNELTWKFIYHDAAKTIKDYKLVPDAKSAERFVIDEGNGVLLDCRLTGSVFQCQFSLVGDPSVFVTRYELRKDSIGFELTVSRPAAKTTGDGKVQAYTVGAVQSAELKKK